MQFTLFMPYQASMYDSADNSAENYYSSEEDYINALRQEEATTGAAIFNAMTSGNFGSSTLYDGFSSHQYNYHPNVAEKVAYAKADCTLYSPNGAVPETVDSMVDKFASQKPFIVMANFNMSSMDGEFEEELREWTLETREILKHQKDMGGQWVDENIPKRNMRLSFLNKSNKEVRFELSESEIEEKIAGNRYLFYVNRISILK